MIVLLLLAFSLLIAIPSLNGQPLYDDHAAFVDTDRGTRTWRSYMKLSLWHVRPLNTAIFDIADHYVPKPANGEPYHLMPVLHLINALLHWGCGCMVFVVARQAGFSFEESAVASILFVVHPLAWSAVAPLATRAILLSELFGLMAIALTLAGHPLLAVPVAAVAVLAREDAVILFPLIVALTGLQDMTMAASLTGAGLLAALVFWKPVFRVMKSKFTHNGDEVMGGIDMPVSLPQPAYTVTAITENVIRWFGWTLGLGQNVDPEIREAEPDSWRLIVTPTLLAAVLLALIIAPYRVQVAILLIICSAWLASWFFPLPDIVSESRAYGTVAGLALLLAPIAHWPWLTVMLTGWLAFRATWRSFIQREGIPFWLSAWREDKPKLRVAMNIGAAYQSQGNLAKAMEWHLKGEKLSPLCGGVQANIGLWHEGMCRAIRGEFASKYVMMGTTNMDEAQKAQDNACASLRTAVEVMQKAMAVSPDNKTIAFFHANVIKHASVAGVLKAETVDAEMSKA